MMGEGSWAKRGSHRRLCCDPGEKKQIDSFPLTSGNRRWREVDSKRLLGSRNNKIVQDKGCEGMEKRGEQDFRGDSWSWKVPQRIDHHSLGWQAQDEGVPMQGLCTIVDLGVKCTQ